MQRRSTALPGPLSSLELFSGAGGLALGLHLAGFRHRSLFEYEDVPFATLERNIASDAVPGVRTWTVRHGDVREVVDYGAFGKTDLLAGGAPCQPFSIGGKQSGRADRRDMLPEFVRAVREARPRAFMLENVRGLSNSNFRAYFDYVQLQLSLPEIERVKGETWRQHGNRLQRTMRYSRSALRYQVAWHVLNAADYGVPQMRERVFIVGFREDVGAVWTPPPKTHSIDALLWDQFVTRDYWERHGLRSRRLPDRLCGRIARIRDLPVTRPWVTIREALAGLPAPARTSRSESVLQHVHHPGARLYDGHTGSDCDMPSKTIKAGDHGVPGGENIVLFRESGRFRYFTIREAARIQTFPDTWSFEGGWKWTVRQVGNAVPPTVAETVGLQVAEELAPISTIMAA